MNADRERRSLELAEAAAELDPESRAAFLRDRCGDDLELRCRVDALLDARSAPTDVLDKPLVDPGPIETDEQYVENLIGQRVDGYTIKQSIGHGGHGYVFEAMQHDPRRLVALKLLRQGIRRPAVIRRFREEAQFLARLDHPNIATVYGSGIHDDGSGAMPFLAVEYVPSRKTLVEYAREQRLSTRQRLQMFIGVCDAVHHAHQKAIIHRDLSPDNILVSGSGELKLIDFSIAHDVEAEPVTMDGERLGKWQYMSPEQLESPRNVDARSDVYSLGVILYELVTEALPYDATSIFEAMRVVPYTTPVRPSRVRQSLRGPVEAVILKALEKQPASRYASAAALGADLQAYLADRPVSAVTVGPWYETRLFVRRNKLVSGLLLSLLVLFAALGVIVIYSYFTTERMRSDVHASRASADQYRCLAVAELVEAAIGSGDIAQATAILHELESGLRRQPRGWGHMPVGSLR